MICKTDQCNEPVYHYGKREYCKSHYYTWVSSHSDPTLRRKPDDQITYCTAHKRVRRAFGSATEHTCSRCPNQAYSWALKHDAENTFWGKNNATDPEPLPYSANVNDYMPMCASCHKLYDNEIAARKHPQVNFVLPEKGLSEKT